jgi:putative N-acetylmannosamine-6-phosphate epimerase
MLQTQRTKRRTHFDPESNYVERRTHFDPESQYVDATLRRQKDELLQTLADYIAKKKTKDETLADLSAIQEECIICVEEIK